jgi:pimeloyl-ACP methyl ester carboxylesterase
MPHIQLSAGLTHYELTGPTDGPLVVLIHGISIPMWTWDTVVPPLVRAGFRVLRYDAFGRGESDYPRRAYDRKLLVTQLTELLHQLGVNTPFNLVGFSFGGALAASFTALHKDKVRRLALVAPFARMTLPDKRVWLRHWPLGELVMRFKVLPDLQTRAARLLETAGDADDTARKFEQQLGKPGFAPAFLSLMRTDAMDDYGAAYESVARSGIPTALTWGTRDTDIPRESIHYTRTMLQPKVYREVEGADHGSILQPAHQLDTLLISFFSSTQGI